MSTRGAQGWVWKTPTGLPDCTSIVSSSPRPWRVRTIASNASHERAARPVPPYTTRSSGRSATSGSRLFISIRMAASWGQPRQLSSLPLGARTGRGPLVMSLPLVHPTFMSVAGDRRSARIADMNDRGGSFEGSDGGLGRGQHRARADQRLGRGQLRRQPAVRTRRRR